LISLRFPPLRAIPGRSSPPDRSHGPVSRSAGTPDCQRTYDGS
jgi:hypothetical protein